MRRAKKEKSIPEQVSVSVGHTERLITEEGVALLAYRIEVPSVSGTGVGVSRISDFYGEILKHCVVHVETALLDALRRQYLGSEDPHKRFRFRRLQYCHAVSTALNDTGELLVLRCISVKRAGRELYKRMLSERWRLSDGRLLRAGKAEEEGAGE